MLNSDNMDEEGYPLLREDARFITTYEEPMQHCNIVSNNYINNENDLYKNKISSYSSQHQEKAFDEESGEEIGRRVVVIRSTQRGDGISWSELACLRHSIKHSHTQLFQDSLENRTLHMHRELLSSIQNNGRLPPYFINGFESEELEVKLPFRIPLPQTEVKSTRGTNEVTISIWREFCRGPHVYEDTALEWQALRNECTLWPHLQSFFGESAKFVPLCAIWLLRLFLFLIKICVPCLGLQLMYFHLLYTHIMIHLTGEKRGLEPVFVGKASQGPLIYSIRHLSCPYCRNIKQRKNSLKYFDSLYRERKEWAAR